MSVTLPNLSFTEQKTSTAISLLSPFLLTVSQLDQQLRELSIRTMQEITQDTQRRLDGCLQNPALLDQGMFDAYAYFEKLHLLRTKYVETEQVGPLERLENRLAALTNRGAFYHGFAHKEFFIHKHDPFSLTEKMVYGFHLVAKKSPSKALLSLIGPNPTFSIMGCTAVAQFCYAKALLDVLGEEKFDHLFAFNSHSPFEIMSSSQSLYLVLLQNKHGKHPRMGDWLGIPGPQLYFSKHWNGNAGCWNVLVQSTQSETRYIGWGLPTKGVTNQELFYIFVKEFNKKPALFKMLPPEKVARLKREDEKDNLLRKQMKTCQISIEQLKAEREEKPYRAFSINTRRVHALACGSLKEADALMNKWFLEFIEQ